MTSLHPAIVHFPIALISIAALFAVISLFSKREFFKEAAFWNLMLGVIAAIAAALSGFIEERKLVHNEAIHQVLIKHKFNGLGILVLSFALLTWVWIRKNKFGKIEYSLWVFFLVAGLGMAFYQGFLGGKMVYELGAGVKPLEPYMEHEAGHSTHDHSSSGHDRQNTGDTSLPSQVMPEKTEHGHPGQAHDHSPKTDTSKKKDEKTMEKKKELKDMKY